MKVLKAATRALAPGPVVRLVTMMFCPVVSMYSSCVVDGIVAVPLPTLAMPRGAHITLVQVEPVGHGGLTPQPATHDPPTQYGVPPPQ